MLEWIDHDTFQKKGFATFYNYSNFVRISLMANEQTKLIGLDLNGHEWILEKVSSFDSAAVDTLKKDFIKFMNNRPPITPTVPVIESPKIQI